MKNLSPIANFLIELSQEASKIMLKYFSPLGVMATLKEDMSPVTKADLEINEMVINKIREKYPDYEVLAEEASTDTTKSNKLFVVDPLDGTKMFAIGSPNFGFSAAVVIGGKSIAGVLCNPLAKRTLIAEEGKGAYLFETGTKIQVSNKKDFERALINAGWEDVKETATLHTLGAKTPEFYSICEAASLVALGGLDGEVFAGKNAHNAHDVAAVKVIVEEAGGKVTDINGREQRYDQKITGAVISNGHLHDRLVKILADSGVNKNF